MPGRDRTGPQSQGPMTGRGLGYCAGNDDPGSGSPAGGRFMGRGWGRGFGMGRGRGYGRGFGSGFGRGFGPDSIQQGVAPQRPDEIELASMRDEIVYLKERIESLIGRIETDEKARNKDDKNK